MLHSFTFKGIRSQQMYLLVESVPPITRPSVRYQSVQLPGRAGELILMEGTDVYEPYVREVRAMPMPNANIHDILDWLRGDGYVSFSNEPKREQYARALDQIDFVHAFAQQREGIIRFMCDPFKRQIPEESSITFNAQSPVITNPGDVIAWPDLTISGTGSIAVSIGASRQGYEGLVSGTPVHVDCNAGYAYTRGSEDASSVLYSVKTPVTTYGDFPYISPGENTIMVEGNVTQLVIKPNWRWL